MLRNRILERIVFEVSDVAKGPLAYNDTPLFIPMLNLKPHLNFVAPPRNHAWNNLNVHYLIRIHPH